ncbi:MAG: amidohydrolase [candidate division KSB1 bacterium]|nr:amidohydrolase [candidate division KSB1 bacterium]MDZ7366190.1 amidohydrolase [candidate division KSB1 bacterium]MDZ7404408.1 amidohydrolase [candidate division KSB1 bacterium]
MEATNRRWQLLIAALSMLWLSCSAEQADGPRPSDLVLRNGAIYTMNAAREWAEAVAVDGGRIVYVGTDSAVKKWIGGRTQVVDLQGKMVLPGFHDSHVHPLSGGLELGECNLNGLETQEQILEAIRRFAQQNPAASWIRGGGWDLPIFPNANPHKSLLDQIVSDRPVYLSAADGHSVWVNSTALQIAGITKETPDTPNGRIERDPQTGEPTGTLREDAARLVAQHLPEYKREDYVNGLRRGLEMANRFGITSLQEASADSNDLEAYLELDRRGELTARVVAAIDINPAQGIAQIPRLVALRKKFHGKRLRANAVKIFADGVIEARTAAVLKPYLDYGDLGKANFEAGALKTLVTALDSAGFQIHIHAIGDRGIRMALDAYQAAREKNGSRDSRHHIAHLELIDPEDIPRFRRLGVVANFQSLWAYADKYITDLTEPALGPARSRWLYPIASVMKTGAVVAGGSDWSVSSMNPLAAMQVAVTRRGLADSTGAAWHPEELVDLAPMIAAYTINGAYVNFEEKETGSIETGKAADLIVLDRNIFEIPVNTIHRAKVLLTLLDGKQVYRATSFNNE